MQSNSCEHTQKNLCGLEIILLWKIQIQTSEVWKIIT
jgi:hypothetical protein